ncbi:MAG: DUF3127 domain-containing protein [Leadbetterella sp.]
MDISGKIISLLPLATGEGKNGPWKKQDFVIETEGQYPKKVCISAWGEKFDGLIAEGKPVTVHFDVESREYNGRWYTDLRAWRIDQGMNASASAPVSSGSSAPAPVPVELEGEDDLPF